MYIITETWKITERAAAVAVRNKPGARWPWAGAGSGWRLVPPEEHGLGTGQALQDLPLQDVNYGNV